MSPSNPSHQDPENPAEKEAERLENPEEMENQANKNQHDQNLYELTKVEGACTVAGMDLPQVLGLYFMPSTWYFYGIPECECVGFCFLCPL